MTWPDWFTDTQRAAAEQGHARALADVAAARPDDPEVEIEDPVDVAVDIAGIIAETREQLQLHATAAAAMVDIPTGDRL